MLDKDNLKEKFLLELKQKAIPVTEFVNDNKYKIWGLPFFNKDNKQVEFNQALDEMID